MSQGIILAIQDSSRKTQSREMRKEQKKKKKKNRECLGVIILLIACLDKDSEKGGKNEPCKLTASKQPTQFN